MRIVRFVALLAVLPLGCLGTGVGNPSQESNAGDANFGDAASDVMAVQDAGSDVIGIDVTEDIVTLDSSTETGGFPDVQEDPSSLPEISEDSTPWPDVVEADSVCCDDPVEWDGDTDGDAGDTDVSDGGDVGDVGDTALGQ